MMFGSIFKSIVDGELKEGERLPSEESLSEKFKVSRPTVREALARLRAGGLILSRQGSGSYVGRPPNQPILKFTDLDSLSDIQRCYEFRLGIESGAAELAAMMRDDNDIEQIEAAYGALDDAIKRGTLGTDEDFAFHLAIAAASKNHLFYSVLLSIKDQTRFSMSLSRNLSRDRSVARQMIAQQEHRAVIDAIIRQDAVGARNAMHAHITQALNRIFFGETSGQQPIGKLKEYSA
ncbi:FadR/GntR family transcriptional regulator [Noviherbaspirillum saxi]|uniref:FadR family transcriptional regulator n=1 Tax=Noviherbaspirillum saxi TaxID=2320863 RepID=A0A3A3FMN3_9BURK|nr:FadR/GntR family transcriptional regulator [Noviherbaspirillum saxi]RJF92792.1 FadR family transcriptional regulator [Noviherbaspirillum saxi]